MPINARQGRYVRIIAPTGPPGFECQRDLGLALSDGRRIARLVDICQSNFLVVVALVGGPRPPPPPQASCRAAAAGPAAAAAADAQPQPALPPPPAGPSSSTGMVWMFDADGSQRQPRLRHPEHRRRASSPRSAQRGRARSRSRSTARRPGSAPGSQVAVRFTAGAFAKTYTATGSPVSELSGLSHPVMQISAPAIRCGRRSIRESVLTIAIGPDAALRPVAPGSAAQGVRQFLAACNPPPRPAGAAAAAACPVPAPTPSASSATTARSSASPSTRRRAVVNEPGVPPIVLFRAPSQGGARYVGGLSELIGRAEEIYWTRDGGFAAHLPARTSAP